ncbi:MAG: M20/M25/M40 family metallo-hydrolase [Bacteroidetes bacterium]|nr:M20/M25/M40 family metallo-hydrolase [Bacteroidota bacterium]MBV6460820.1 hypothetical protein [Flavobacteriales bacterium]WKZ75821.1 MAG: M20/M25/M40 family metallo-hydrolase [Vicingaceae bacterium]NOG95679.1 M20/M25/M40 family metallo-hydrolase [Bacteroidota bacterium]CAG0969896.1 Putative aminopeptidase YsdC [Flavobacteriales bacterium]
MQLLKKLCAVHAPSGNEKEMTDFLLNYIKKNASSWKKKPIVFTGNEFQESIVLVFGNPTTALFAHIDSIGFTAGYNNELIKIGGPVCENDFILSGKDSKGKIECKLVVKKNEPPLLSAQFKREIERGTTLTFKPLFKESKEYVQSNYLDNRLGVWIALQTAKTLENGIIAFTTYEEHGGGNAQFIGKFIYEKYKVRQALIADITWITKGVQHGKGAAISLRDSLIPRKVFTDKIVALIKKAKIPFQLEVESAGGSDGSSLQRSSLSFDWCFIGAAENNVHSPNEKVHKKDIDSMLRIYQLLMKKL